MKLSHLTLAAFHQCAQTLNMTLAAKELGITQSALSQRLAQLEDELSCTLFVREARGLILTEEGARLLRYTETEKLLEDELLRDLQGKKGELGGTLRIAGYSSIMRSLIIPALSPFLRKHPGVQVSFQTHEMSDLPDVLNSSRADFIIMDHDLKKKGILEEALGEEEYVVIESSRHPTPKDVYLDHDPHDTATESFFVHQGKIPSYRRSFMGEVYGIIQGVEEGLGRAVMSRHLIEDNKKIKIVSGFKSFKQPITLHYFERPYYTELSKFVLKELKDKLT